ncbi:universal stress protein [Alicyclobacillus vulcanalis]|nr:universal stress protein [Alicyclobacillus vulcanalis]
MSFGKRCWHVFSPVRCVVFREEYRGPADVSVEVANAVDADFLVLGIHGRTGLDRVLMGSVSTAVVHRARQVGWW